MVDQIKKDIIIKRADGLYAMKAGDELGWTNKANAWHFSGKVAAKNALPGLHLHTVEFIDLNSKRKRGK